MAASHRNAPRLLLDECIWKSLASKLREQGFDVWHVIELGQGDLDDEPLLTYATAENRTILTANNKDFAKLAREWAISGKTHAGIVLSNQMPPGQELISLVINLLQTETVESLRGRVRFLSDFRQKTS